MMGVFQKWGENPPKWMVKIMENTFEMDDLGGNPLFLETSIWTMKIWWTNQVEFNAERSKMSHSNFDRLPPVNKTSHWGNPACSKKEKHLKLVNLMWICDCDRHVSPNAKLQFWLLLLSHQTGGKIAAQSYSTLDIHRIFINHHWMNSTKLCRFFVRTWYSYPHTKKQNVVSITHASMKWGWS